MTLPSQDTERSEQAEHAPDTERSVTADLYHQVHSFYAHQMQLLDSGQVEAWAETFTEEGVFSANAHPRPTRGRAAIVAGARAARARLAEQGLRHRHWLGMVDVEPLAEDRLRVRSYALVLAIAQGGPATVHVHTTCDDTLVRVGGRWQVSTRLVARDDLTAEPAR
ncbi:nuclear transport factor 2 family protein [Streptomyces sp. NPDC102283]|uniref:nuclear transport factor 2 family protein n=1 Tax=Streptomyces sp. NPDC102283 TaxID=3366155 RepID=UPI003808A4C8